MWNQFVPKHEWAGYLDKEIGHEEGSLLLFTLEKELLGVRAGLSQGSTLWWPKRDNIQSKRWVSQNHTRDIKIIEKTTHFWIPNINYPSWMGAELDSVYCLREESRVSI